MRRILCIAVGVMVEFPDDTIGVCAPLPKSPLEELAERLRHEACCGRDRHGPSLPRPRVLARMAADYQECND
jgi:hypothetical protein